MAKMSKRLATLPPNQFRELTALKAKLRQSDKDYIDLSEGIPDQHPPIGLTDKLSLFCGKQDVHGYPTRWGIAQLRQKLLHSYLEPEYGIDISRVAVLPAAGSKELIAHICQALIDPGDIVLIPEYYYPIYPVAACYAGAEVRTYPLSRDGLYYPLLQSVSTNILNRTKLLFLNYPHNPTGAVIDQAHLDDVRNFCRKWGIVLCSDLAYGHLIFENSPALSAIGNGVDPNGIIELHSFSKCLHIPGWRVACAVGDPEIVSMIESSKAVFDTGLFIGIQKALSYGLVHFKEYYPSIRNIYWERVDYFCQALKEIGINHVRPRGTFYIWAQTPLQSPKIEFVTTLLSEASVLVMPGRAFGDKNDEHFRISLTQPMPLLIEAIKRIEQFIQK